MPHFLKSSLLLFMLVLEACTAQNKTMTTETDIIQDTYWMLISLEGEDVQFPNDTRTAYIRFEEGEDEVKGFTGCNDFFGKYQLNGENLQISELESTRVMCPIIEQERKFKAILERAKSYSISDYLLTFYDNGGTAIATFRAGNDSGTINNEQ